MSSFWRHRIDGWRDEGTESGTEKRHAQQLWSDLMQCFDIASERIDVFERNADRASTGGRGYIDFFWSGVVIGEAKSLNVPLDRAYHQVLDYLNGGSVGTHEWPRFILVTNFEASGLTGLAVPTSPGPLNLRLTKSQTISNNCCSLLGLKRSPSGSKKTLPSRPHVLWRICLIPWLVTKQTKR